MTLVELLVTLLILSILGALVIGVAGVAGETARESRTRNMVDRIHTLLMEHMDTYKTRRVRVRPEVLSAIETSSLQPRQKREAIAAARLYALRELMLMEMPDRWSDIALTTPTLAANYLYPLYLDVSGSGSGRSPLGNVLLRRYQQYAANASNVDNLIENEGAECLYLVVTLATADGEARTLFHESNIGDTDGDGALEFLDGWGNPIEFVRWAPGFDSEIQINATEFGIPPTTPDLNAWRQAASGDHDPYDLFRAEDRAFRLVPLVVSAGRDEEWGIHFARPPQQIRWPGIADLSAAFNETNPPKLDPYNVLIETGGINAYLGQTVDAETAADNIHNHLIGVRQ